MAYFDKLNRKSEKEILMQDFTRVTFKVSYHTGQAVYKKEDIDKNLSSFVDGFYNIKTRVYLQWKI